MAGFFCVQPSTGDQPRAAQSRFKQGVNVWEGQRSRNIRNELVEPLRAIQRHLRCFGVGWAGLLRLGLGWRFFVPPRSFVITSTRTF